MNPTRRSAALALALLVPVPTLATAAAMVWAPGSAWAQALFFAAKLWILALPAVWHVWIDRQPPTFPRPRRAGMLAAGGTGALIVIVIAAAWFAVGKQWIDPTLMRDKAAQVGLTSPLIYLLGALYWCTLNSFLEEYVWRWFVFTRCETITRGWPMGRWLAVSASALFFTLHHIVALQVYFDWRTTLVAAAGVFIGGAVWSWLYLRYRNLWAAYVSHVFADVVIFVIGYGILFGIRG
jgi:membrane protease YdiL (CAAX protease family)